MFGFALRLGDLEIVAKATEEQQEVLPCFIIDPWFYQQPEIGAARDKFLFESLENLDVNLRKQGSRLHLFEGDSVSVLKTLTLALLEQGKYPKLYFSKDVQVNYGIERDRSILDFYRQHNLETYVGTNHFLQLNSNRLDRWWQDYHDYLTKPLYLTPPFVNTPRLQLNLPQLTFAELKQKYRSFWEAGSHRFAGGENHALNKLDSFLNSRYRGYHWRMSRPWLAQQGASSHLSPHLAFGTVSTRTVYQRTKKLLEQLTHQPKAEFALKSFLDRLRWHDKFTQRLYFYPELATQNRYPEFDEWYSPEALSGHRQELFEAWCEGRTGFPLVDASMRQLNQMGWMNFRMRAMCVTFLTINCGVSWHHGARYFMSRLVDGDIAIDQTVDAFILLSLI